MEVSIIVLTALTTAVVSGIVNGLVWLLFRRTIANLDAASVTQAGEIAKLRDERVRLIEQQIKEHATARKDLYVRIENEYLRRSEHDRQDDRLDRRIESIFGDIGDVKATIGNIDRRLAGVETTNSIIAKNLQLRALYPSPAVAQSPRAQATGSPS